MLVQISGGLKVAATLELADRAAGLRVKLADIAPRLEPKLTQTPLHQPAGDVVQIQCIFNRDRPFLCGATIRGHTKLDDTVTGVLRKIALGIIAQIPTIGGHYIGVVRITPCAGSAAFACS